MSEELVHWALRADFYGHPQAEICSRKGPGVECDSLRVQVLNNEILALNLYYKYYYQTPKYLVIGYMDPSGLAVRYADDDDDDDDDDYVLEGVRNLARAFTVPVGV